MRSKILRLFAAVFAAAVIIPAAVTSAIGSDEGASVSSPEIPYRSYTYWKDVNTSDKVAVYSKPMYSCKKSIISADIGGNAQTSLSDISAFGGDTYILDGGAGKIYILNKSYVKYKTVENVKYKGETLDFTGAQGLYTDKNGLIYIADTENERVIVTDTSCNVRELILLPDSPLIPTEFEYKPVKVTVDDNGYAYIVSQGSYYGAILYSPEREFLGFFGANTVKGTVKTILTNIYNRLFSNDTKRAADTISLPYTLTDITVGPDNFIYTATGITSEKEKIQTGQICVYNPGGKDVLGASGSNFADADVGVLKNVVQTQDLSSLAVDSEGYMYILDATYGRIFVYDRDENILSVFGGSMGAADQRATFYAPSAIEINGTDIIVTDSQKNNITVFEITEYGRLVKQADSLALKGDLTAALPLWREVNRLDGNNQLAYRGIAKALYDMGENREAMKYAYNGYDRETYGKAFKIVRNEWIESHFALTAVCIALFAAAVTAFAVIKKKKNLMLIKSARLKTLSSCLAHPVDSFREVKEKNTGSVTAAGILLVIFYIVTVLNDISGGFIFTVFDSGSYNSLYVLLSTVGLVLLFTVSNWLICTLFGGIGRLKEIFIVTCYSLIPIIIGLAAKLVLTHLLIEEEGAFMGIMVYAFILYAAFMLIIGLMRIHDYEFGRFIGTTVLTLCAMLVIIFILFLVFMLVQQVYGWVITVYSELKY